MKKPIVLKNKKLCIDIADVFAVWYPYYDMIATSSGRESKWQLSIWLEHNGVKGEFSVLYDCQEEAVADYEQLIEELSTVKIK